uniref:Uncharacterized protein n=1 Tax=Anguilla anguilla TaxID=7936 RepID=A0A0E9SCK7_ANGAN
MKFCIISLQVVSLCYFKISNACMLLNGAHFILKLPPLIHDLF